MENNKSKFDLGSSKVLKTFLYILIPTLIAQVIGGTFVVFDSFFVSNGFHPGQLFDGIGKTLFDKNSYSSLGPAAISYAMPYTFFIIGLGLAIGAGLSSIIIKNNANNNLIESKRAFNAYAPLVVIVGAVLVIVISIFSKFFVWLGSGFQKDYLTS
jgi:Na+-driven multidrug efflux pump